MRHRPFILLLLIPLAAAEPSPSSSGPSLVEIVADPQTDWNDDGRVTGSDEFVEILNTGSLPLDLSGWSLMLNDSTPQTVALAGTIEPGHRLAIVNPAGELNNNAHVAIIDPTGAIVHEVRYGTWTGATAPSADATGALDEALRFAGVQWTKGHATPGQEPIGPMMRAASPFVAGEDARWYDVGNRSVAFSIEWADSDHTIGEARVELLGTEETRTATASPGMFDDRGKADVVVTTPQTSFAWRWVLTDHERREWPAPWASVIVDCEAPRPPVLDLPPWTNRENVTVRARPVTDEGVGRIEYALESVDGANATWVSSWSPSPDVGAVAIPARESLVLRALARDALGNQVVGPNATVRFDATPPQAPHLTAWGGYDRIRLSWTTLIDEGSGASTVHVRRLEPTVREWNLPAALGTFEDDSFVRGDRLVYDVSVVDAAGNEGNATRIAVPYEGEQPHVKKIRLSKPIWGSGTLRVYADFDRRMDTTTDADVRIDGERRDGRWLANATTYVVELDAFEGEEAGEASIAVADAKAPGGVPLWAPVQRAVPTDGEAPPLSASDIGGWVNASGLRLSTGEDATIRYRVGDATDWSEATGNVTIAVSGEERVRAYAMDAGGWRSREIDRIIRVDDEAPALKTPTFKQGTVRWETMDASGVADAAATDAASGKALETRIVESTIIATVGDARTVRVEVRDRAGNVAMHEWSAPAGVEHVEPVEDAANRVALPQSLGSEPGTEEERSPSRTLGAAGVGVLLAFAVAGLVRVRSRKKTKPSLARRLRRLRAARRLF